MNLKHIQMTMLFACVGLFAFSQANKDSTIREMDEIVVSGSRFEERKKNVIQKIDIINATKINRTNAQNMGDLLMSTGNIFVQKSQQGGSSPVIRGFEASRVLLVVDGVRMNNAIYRSGHLQNVITVDQQLLDRVEIIQGPSSTIFGSDALGGAVHMITRKPETATGNKKTLVKSNLLTRFSSANSEKTFHADINVGGKKWASLTSVTHSDFGDLKMGRKVIKGFEGFGTRPFYIKPFDGANGDTILKNSNDRIQRYSGYQQLDLMEKIFFQSNDKVSHTLNLQYSTSSDVPRYDRLQDIRNGALRFASWYYGPQLRKMASYQLNIRNANGFFSEYQTTLSYQDIEESRITREYKRYDRFDRRQENIGVGGLTFNAKRSAGNNTIIAGVDFQTNVLQSTASRTNLLTKVVDKLDTRYPDGKNRMQTAGLFVQHRYRFGNDKWLLNEGLRYQFNHLFSSINDNSFFQLPVTSVRQQTGAFTGNLGIVYQIDGQSRIKMGFASGFRAPNIDDLSKIFESSTATRQVVIPNDKLKPEYTGTFDLGLNWAISKGMELEVGGYYTQFTNAIIKAPFQLNGQDSIIYNNVKSQVLASQNVNKAYITGANIELNAKLNEAWKINATLNVIRGQFKTNSSKTSAVYQKQNGGGYALVQAYVDTKPLDHIPPTFGRVGINYEKDKLHMELFMMYNGWKRLDQYNADGEDNAQYATPSGTPAWQTFNFRAGYHLGKRWHLQAACENILDLNYRFFASGFSASGRNWVVSINTKL